MVSRASVPIFWSSLERSFGRPWLIFGYLDNPGTPTQTDLEIILGSLPMERVVNVQISVRALKVKNASAYGKGLVIFLALVTLVGCQGLSAGSPANQQQPQAGVLGLSGSALGFGTVVVGSGKTLTVTAKNTGAVSLTVTSAQSTAPQFVVSKPTLPLTIAAGSNATLSVTFTPQTAGSASGTISIASDASDGTVGLQVTGAGAEPGSPGALSPNPSSLSFGSVQVGHNLSLSETVTNNGGSDATITDDPVTGAGFSVSGLNLPLTLTPGGSTTFSVVFAPQSTGAVNGNLTITSDASNPSLLIPLSGTGTASGGLSISPTSLNFGNVLENNNSSLPASLKASSTSVTVTSAVSSSSEFTFSGLTFPVTIQAGNSIGFTVTFTPQSTGQANATLTFTSDASNSPTVQSLTGNGTAPTQHSVLLNWNPSSSQDIVGYNVYRGIQTGGPYSPIDTLDANTTYTDSSVTNGDTYYYVTTAVNSSNEESGYSNEAQAKIPNN